MSTHCISTTDTLQAEGIFSNHEIEEFKALLLEFNGHVISTCKRSADTNKAEQANKDIKVATWRLLHEQGFHHPTVEQIWEAVDHAAQAYPAERARRLLRHYYGDRNGTYEGSIFHRLLRAKGSYIEGKAAK